MQAALRDAIDVKLAKEGEVSILRKSAEKVFCLSDFPLNDPYSNDSPLDISNSCSPNSAIKG